MFIDIKIRYLGMECCILDGVLWLSVTYHVRFPVQCKLTLITAQPRLWIGSPSDIDTV